MRFFAPDYVPVASWSLGGKPLPFVPFKVTPEQKAVYAAGELASFVPFFRDGLAQADPTLIEKTRLASAEVAGFKLRSCAAAHPGSGTQMFR